MTKYRSIRQVIPAKPVIEGAGVHLKRVFGYNEVPLLDPFLLLDDFHSDNPKDYIAGFPDHPHRGIETVTYMLQGKIEHKDSIGNQGIISNGDIQWMSAGSGIIHSEMPKQEQNLLWGFQLWVNLPAEKKMSTPRYQEIKSHNVPLYTTETGIKIKVIAGNIANICGPVKDISIDPEFLDITIPPHCEFVHSINTDHTLFAYVIQGKITNPDQRPAFVNSQELAFYDQGEEICIQSESETSRVLLISGKPIGEPIAWHGPIVMNNDQEINNALDEYRNGTFIK